MFKWVALLPHLMHVLAVDHGQRGLKFSLTQYGASFISQHQDSNSYLQIHIFFCFSQHTSSQDRILFSGYTQKILKVFTDTRMSFPFVGIPQKDEQKGPPSLSAL